MTIDFEVAVWAVGSALVLLGLASFWLAVRLFSVNAYAARLEAQLESERLSTVEKLALMEEARGRLAAEFQNVSAGALAENTRRFMELARGDFEDRREAVEGLVEPMREELEKFGEQVRLLELERERAYAALREQIGNLSEGHVRLQAETGNLVRALHSSGVRGRWGEITLRRVVELVGMQNQCDFVEQPTATGEDGRLRPDLVVRLPGGKEIVVDSKVALDAYLDALETPDEPARMQHLDRHARQVRAHVERLSSKAYWAQFDASPEVVVMFMPLETGFTAAVERDPHLLEWAVERRVIPVSPMTLIALLQAVHYGWKQDQMTANARTISVVGRELHDRIAAFADHMSRLGKGLTAATDSYNKAVGSLERMVLSKARQLRDLGAGSGDTVIEEPPAVEAAPRNVTMNLDTSNSQSDA